jgi:hypothetical protein
MQVALSFSRETGSDHLKLFGEALRALDYRGCIERCNAADWVMPFRMVTTSRDWVIRSQAPFKWRRFTDLKGWGEFWSK